ncbi:MULTISPECIES: hypothetical protein [unclassified Streptomyces]|uniref:SCO2102 family sporulation regulator n=1 Tax=unclassified Streptomyces TaxID=2593676 RepID=UPI003D7594A0
MGWTVLYIAFGVVALWLLGEVLLQYKARLRWRLLAFAGFLGVVLGVLIPSIPVIALGAATFAIGQTYVTLSFRRGFAAGWAVKRPEGDGPVAKVAKRRRGRADRQDPVLDGPGPDAPETAGEDTDAYGHDDPDRTRSYDDDYGHDYEHDYDRDDVFTPAARTDRPGDAETTAVYEPQPLPEDTGSYGVYGDSAYAQSNGAAQDQYAATGQSADQSYGYDAYQGYGQQSYDYDTSGGQQQYAAYSDPYIGTQTYGGGYDTGYTQQGYGDQYGTGYGETPAGGVWVPQQRGDDPLGGELPPDQQQYPYPGDGQGAGGQQGNGYDEQYRF